jgi:hypothetical protein
VTVMYQGLSGTLTNGYTYGIVNTLPPPKPTVSPSPGGPPSPVPPQRPATASAPGSAPNPLPPAR